MNCDPRILLNFTVARARENVSNWILL